MTVSPLRQLIGHLIGEETTTWTVSVTRGEAIEYLVDAGVDDEDRLADLSDADLLTELLENDEARERLDDMASEKDSSAIRWEVDQ